MTSFRKYNLMKTINAINNLTKQQSFNRTTLLDNNVFHKFTWKFYCYFWILHGVIRLTFLQNRHSTAITSLFAALNTRVVQYTKGLSRQWIIITYNAYACKRIIVGNYCKGQIFNSGTSQILGLWNVLFYSEWQCPYQSKLRVVFQVIRSEG